jgi:WD40 repeat protein
MRFRCSYISLPAAAVAVVTSFSACADSTNPTALAREVSASQRPGSAQAHAAMRRHAVGLGPVVEDALGGTIFGWDINTSGSDGVLAESLATTRVASIGAVETFDQTTGKITKIVSKERSVSGNRDFVADGILANDLGLIDNERDNARGRNDIFDVMAPVTGNRFTGKWNPPNKRGLLVVAVSDQQADSTVAIYALTKGPEVLVSDVATDDTKYAIPFPRNQGPNLPYLIAQDTSTNAAYVPYRGDDGYIHFNAFDLAKGTVSTFRGVHKGKTAGSGPAQGIAIDSTTGTMCTTTGGDYSVEFYNLRTRKGTWETLPRAGGELTSGGAIAVDYVNHLFLVTQPVSSVSPSGGSTIFVYSENGTLEETLNGFSFSNAFSAVFERVEVNPSQRTGYVNGPGANELQEFTY